ncbi:ABC transporter substrate-binding protein [Actibacterium sp. 188UL27-1]|uniref:ABC transporter substrate-binding protein n=1 Tax=Actibacterium sp. 188UL27-1 TaxID=2786961 RepID=UPI001957C2EF|nr:ABC transporter substrate-binding protein [Actibacterium sp. 188UL27-1]MBM7068247.1 ABC transporter substrate-binding protein [Actibacterium sp. 188UL27-1]
MKRTLILTTALTAFGTMGSAADLTIMSWGGAYGTSQIEAYNKPFAEQTGKDIVMVDADNPATPIKAQVEAGNVTIDVADVEYSDAVRLCDEGLLEEIDTSALPAAPDGTAPEDDFIEGALTDCAVANIVWSTVYAYNSDVVEGEPTTMADFFDLEGFPGKRGMRKAAKANLEMALMADGVPAGEVYDMLETDEGVDRAFAKLDTIKDEIVWWEAGAQPPQLLADGEVTMSTAYNGRIFNAAVSENQPFEIVWDGQILDFDLFVIPKGAPNKELALDYIKFSTDTQRLADQAKWISYGPARKSSGALVGLYQDGKTEMASHMPTAEANLTNALVNDFEFWADRDTELSERFNAWLAQ